MEKKITKNVFILFIISAISLISFPWIRYFFKDVNYPPLTQTVRFIYLAILGITFILFGLLLYLEGKKKEPIVSFKTKLIIAFLLGVIIMSAWPVFSIDLHCYIMQGRIMGIHGQNPYLVSPEQIKTDPFSEGIFWTHRVAFYGPFWMLISAFLSFCARNSVWVNIYLFKLPILFGYLILIWQSYSLASKIAPEKKDIIATFLAFNPFIFIQYLMDGHNDILMVALAVAAINMICDRKYIIGYLLFGLSILVKYMTVMIVPFLIIIIFERLKDKKDIVKQLLLFFCISIALSFILFIPFLNGGMEVFRNFTTHKLFIGKQGIDTNTLPYFFLLILEKIKILKDVNIIYPPGWIINIFHSIFLCLSGCFFLFAIKRRSDVAIMFSCISMVYISYFTFEAFSFGGWFIIWLLPFLLFSRIRCNFELATAISLAATVSFWKRISFLMVMIIIVYFVYLAYVKMFSKKKNCTIS